MPNPHRQPAINLKGLFCKVYQYEYRRGEAEVRRAALLAVQECVGLTPEQRATLEAISEDRLAVDAIKGDTTFHGIMQNYLPKAEGDVRAREARRLGRRAFDRTAWEVTVKLVMDAVQRTFPDLIIHARYFEEHTFPEYCRCALSNEVYPDDQFAKAVETLDREGFTNELLARLWQEAPEEAADMELPKPTEEPGEREPAQPSPELHLDDDAWLTHQDIAKRIGAEPEAVRKRLDRFRAKNHECYREIGESDRKPREPRYLYHVKAVRPAIAGLIASGETSG